MSDDDVTPADKKLAKAVVDELLNRVYREAGRSVLTKLVWWSIAAVVAVGVVLGAIKIPGAGG